MNNSEEYIDYNEDHSDKFKEQADHDNCSEILRELQHNPEAFAKVKEGMRLDLTDDELLQHLRDTKGPSTVEGNDLDEKWNNFKGDFGTNEQ